jgi:hypothetical protein
MLSALLGGCTLFDRIGNKPYIFPIDGEPYSEVIANYNNGSWFNIFNMDANGCFAGSSVLASSGETVKIHSSKDTFIALETHTNSSFCRIIFSFTPEQNAKYTFTQGTQIEEKTGIPGLLSGSDIYCTVSGQRILTSGIKEPLELKQMNLRPSGLACLRMREAKRLK